MAGQVASIFGRSYGQYWGPKGATILRQVVLTLLQVPDSTLSDAIPLLTDEYARQRWTRELDDPGLRAAWRNFNPADAESLLWKLQDVFLLRPQIRNILGQRRSTVDLEQALNGDGILLISLPSNALVPEDGAFLGGLLVSRIWQVIQARSAIPEARRRFLLAAIDEFETLVSVPTTWEQFLEQARAYRAGLMLAHQHLRQLPDSIRYAVGSNARTKIAFQMEHEDAVDMAPLLRPLIAGDLERLGRHYLAARLCLQGQLTPAFTGPAPAPRPELGHGEELARDSLERHGRPVGEIEAEIRSQPGRPRLVRRPEEVLDWDGDR